MCYISQYKTTYQVSFENYIVIATVKSMKNTAAFEFKNCPKNDTSKKDQSILDASILHQDSPHIPI